MPVRRLNFTNRQRIVQADVDIAVRADPYGLYAFDAALELHRYHFPGDARVFIEAYRQTTLLRFDFGTVRVPSPPDDRSLGQLEAPLEMLFRVRVTAVSSRKGVLLGEADQIRPRRADEQPDQRIPLLPAVPEDLGEELWRVEFEGGTYLKVNKRLSDWKHTARTPAFRALVYPAAMRQILERILRIELVTDQEDPNAWQSRWLRFAATLPGSQPLPNASEDFDEWIENATSAFARRHRLTTTYVESD